MKTMKTAPRLDETSDAGAIPYFTDDIRVDVVSASAPHHVGQRLALRDFSHGETLFLFETASGGLLARLQDGTFIEGEWAV